MSIVDQSKNHEATVYVGNIDERVTEPLMWELFLQAGPVVNVNIPKDRVTQTHQGFGFVEFITPEDAHYASKVMHLVKLFGKPIRCNRAQQDKAQELDVGANLFIGNLDPEVDEKVLQDSFSSFGPIVQARVARDTSGFSKGHGFISFETFQAADAAVEAMNGQFLMNRCISVSYALKKDGKGERHGTAAERLLASQAPKTAKSHRVVTNQPKEGGYGQHMNIMSQFQQEMDPSQYQQYDPSQYQQYYQQT
ncbi:splicing factor 3b [Gorgonomyces haynaldii]|nr:splicing factor 3b [Gorgonomyces haynaldii]